MPPRRAVPAAVVAVLASCVLAGCVGTPDSVRTRLPPGFDGSASSAASQTPSPPAATPTGGAPSPDSTPTTAPAADAHTLSCGDGGAQSIAAQGGSFRVDGRCSELTVSGSDLTVDAGAATVQTLRLSGDRIGVEVAGIEALVVQGNGDTVASRSDIGSVDVSGDETTIDAVGGIGAVVVRGQGNTVRSGAGVESVTVEGAGNTIR